MPRSSGSSFSGSGDEEPENLEKLSKITWTSNIQVSKEIKASLLVPNLYFYPLIWKNGSKKGPLVYGPYGLFGHITKNIFKLGWGTNVASSLILLTGFVSEGLRSACYT